MALVDLVHTRDDYGRVTVVRDVVDAVQGHGGQW
jgi:hypothetical protein